MNRFDTELSYAAKLIDFLKLTDFQNPVNAVVPPFEYVFGANKIEWLQFLDDRSPK